MKLFKQDINNNFICEECGSICKNKNILSRHIKIHKLSQKDYFDKWIKEDGDDICKNPECNNKTEFISFRKKGYKKYCSSYCHHSNIGNLSQSDIAKNKRKETLKKLYNNETYRNPNKCKETKYIKYNNESFNNWQQIKETKKKKYGNENYNNHEKYVNTLLLKYNVINNSQLSSNKEKVRQTFIKNYNIRRTKMEDKGYWIPLSLKSNFELYRNHVNKITKRNIILYGEKYLKNYNSLKEENKNIKQYKNKLTIDHKYSIYQGFLNNISPEIIGSIINLKLITWSENSSKREKCSIDNELLLKEYYDFLNKIIMCGNETEINSVTNT